MISSDDITIKLILKESTTALKPHSDSARLDSELIITHVLSIPRTDFILHPDRVLEMSEIDRIQSLIKKRKQGYPVAYITGVKHFWDVELKVNEATLVPRPETELLVEAALLSFPKEEKVRVIDLGTGSGAIAIAIAKNRPNWDVVACDISEDALKVATENAKNYALDNIEFIQSNWFSDITLSEQFDLIISNPPYIPEQDPHLQQGDVQHEPITALASGPDGLNDIRQLIENAKAFLTERGWLLLEHGYDQAPTVKDIFEQQGYDSVQQAMDLAGHVRSSSAQLANS